MPSGWNDQISSFWTYALCQIVLYENWYYNWYNTGIVTWPPYGGMSYVGDAMNDRASSIEWY